MELFSFLYLYRHWGYASSNALDGVFSEDMPSAVPVALYFYILGKTGVVEADTLATQAFLSGL